MAAAVVRSRELDKPRGSSSIERGSEPPKRHIQTAPLRTQYARSTDGATPRRRRSQKLYITLMLVSCDLRDGLNQIFPESCQWLKLANLFRKRRRNCSITILKTQFHYCTSLEVINCLITVKFERPGHAKLSR